MKPLTVALAAAAALAISDSGPASIDFPADRCEPGYVSYVVSCEVPMTRDSSAVAGF